MVIQSPPRFKPITEASDVEMYFKTKVPYASVADALIDRVARTGCLLRGHFELLSGQHTSIFLRFSRFASESANVIEIARLLGESLRTNRITVDAVMSPDTAGIILAYELARDMRLPRFVARTGDARSPTKLLNNVDLPRGASVLLVNDVVTTGRGMEAMRAWVEARGGKVAGAATFAVRKNRYTNLAHWVPQDERLFAIAELNVENETYGVPSEHRGRDCPLCTAGIGITLSSELN
jgi:orotate phosphoribosyltransferase